MMDNDTAMEAQMDLLRTHLRLRSRSASVGRPAGRRENTNNGHFLENKPKHTMIVDLWIAEPHLKQYEIAERLGLSEPWLSGIVNSDAFKVYAAARLDEHRKKLSDAVITKATKVTINALEKLDDKLEEKNTTVTEVVAAGRFASDVAGFSKQPSATITNNQNVAVITASADALATARRMQAEIAKLNTIEHQHTNAERNHVMDHQVPTFEGDKHEPFTMLDTEEADVISEN